MQQVQVFNFRDSEVRTIVRDGEPWWVANDVCRILDISEAHRSLASLDDDEKGRHTVTTHGGPQEMTVINESGLYSLILRSRKKEAKVFKKWVTSEVLPSIRKTGSYMAPSHPVRNAVTEVDRMAGMINQVVPALAGRITEVSTKQLEMDDRLSAVEERQKATDPRAIEIRMKYLESCKTLLVFGTKGKPQAITFPSYWRELKDLIGINSFKNRAALTVPMMDKCVAYAQEWCKTRGVAPPTLFDEMHQQQPHQHEQSA